MSLDELVLAGELPAPDFIKMDIEGAEYLALLGARNTFAQNTPTIFLATHGRDVHDRCCRLLTEIGYQLTPITGPDLEHTDEILVTR